MHRLQRLHAISQLSGSTDSLFRAVLEVLPSPPAELWSLTGRYQLGPAGASLSCLYERGSPGLEQLSAAFGVAAANPPSILRGERELTSITAAGSWNSETEQGTALAGCQDFVGSFIHLGGERFAIMGSGVGERSQQVKDPSGTYACMRILLRANLRIRDALGEQSALDAAEAVLESDGTLVHVEDSALTSRSMRRALSRCVRQRESAQGFGPLTDPQALAEWNRLSNGEYVFLDYVDSDARRYVVCVRVDEATAATFALTQSEHRVLERMLQGHGNKLIASELDASSSTVTETAQRALRKLGAESLAELSAVLRSRPSIVFANWELGGEQLAALGFREGVADSLAALSRAEQLVAGALLEGQSQRQIAQARGVAMRTVANQVASVYRKFGVSGRRELMAKLAMGCQERYGDVEGRPRSHEQRLAESSHAE